MQTLPKLTPEEIEETMGGIMVARRCLQRLLLEIVAPDASFQSLSNDGFERIMREALTRAASEDPRPCTESPEAPKPEPAKTPQEIGGTHYQEGVKVSPWSLQREMVSSGDAFVDARRADAIKYAFRVKGNHAKLLEDLRKAADSARAGAEHLEKMLRTRQLKKIAAHEAITVQPTFDVAPSGPPRSIQFSVPQDPALWSTQASAGPDTYSAAPGVND